MGEQGLLKYKNTRFCVPSAYQLDIIKGMHTLGHLGVRQTRAQLERHYFWPGMRGAVEGFVRQCVGCAKRAGAPAKVDSGIEVTRANQPWELVSMDLMGPFAEGPKRTKFVLSVMDVYTRYLELVTLPNKQANTVGEAFLRRIIQRYGVPRVIKTDNGREFVNAIWDKMAEHLGFKHITTIPYRPQANPVERVHRTLGMRMRALMEEDITGVGWVDQLGLCQMIYNMSIHDSTGQTPYKMMFGNEMPLPLNYLLPMEEGDLGISPQEVIQRRKLKCQQVAESYARHLGGKLRRRRTPNEDITTFQIGQEVLVYDPTKPGGKFRTSWMGPYIVKEVIAPAALIVRNQLNTKEQRVAVERVKLYPQGTGPKIYPDEVPSPSEHTGGVRVEVEEGEREEIHQHVGERRESAPLPLSYFPPREEQRNVTASGGVKPGRDVISVSPSGEVMSGKFTTENAHVQDEFFPEEGEAPETSPGPEFMTDLDTGEEPGARRFSEQDIPLPFDDSASEGEAENARRWRATASQEKELQRRDMRRAQRRRAIWPRAANPIDEYDTRLQQRRPGTPRGFTPIPGPAASFRPGEDPAGKPETIETQGSAMND